MSWNISAKDFRARLYTGIIVAMAAIALWVLWNYYMVAPWTRDGRVRAEVVRIAPEIAGTIAELHVADNQYVKKGDILFVVDPERFKLALSLAEATVVQRTADISAKRDEARRRSAQQGQDAISHDEQQRYQGAVDVAAADLQEAIAKRDIAKLNMERSVIRSPVNGYITNLTLRAGDYANVGVVQLSIVDSDSFYVIGYFEETKLPRIRRLAPVSVYLMQGGMPIKGHVEGISRGISDLNALPDRDGLANVNPVFTWVRLAQRIPVRITLDSIPDNVHIAAGLTCSVTVSESAPLVEDKRGRRQAGKP